jgi:hypothetical protein
MSRYFIDIRDGRSFEDEDGEPFASADDALRSAILVLSESLAARPALWEEGGMTVEVFDADRRSIGRLVVTAERPI